MAAGGELLSLRSRQAQCPCSISSQMVVCSDPSAPSFWADSKRKGLGVPPLSWPRQCALGHGAPSWTIPIRSRTCAGREVRSVALRVPPLLGAEGSDQCGRHRGTGGAVGLGQGAQLAGAHAALLALAAGTDRVVVAVQRGLVDDDDLQREGLHVAIASTSASNLPAAMQFTCTQV